jgi:hypothetical protein
MAPMSAVAGVCSEVVGDLISKDSQGVLLQSQSFSITSLLENWWS